MTDNPFKGPPSKEPPRRVVTRRAQCDLGDAVCGILEEHGLTSTEVWSMLASESHAWAKCALKEERAAADDELPPRVAFGKECSCQGGDSCPVCQRCNLCGVHPKLGRCDHPPDEPNRGVMPEMPDTGGPIERSGVVRLAMDDMTARDFDGVTCLAEQGSFAYFAPAWWHLHRWLWWGWVVVFRPSFQRGVAKVTVAGVGVLRVRFVEVSDG